MEFNAFEYLEMSSRAQFDHVSFLIGNDAHAFDQMIQVAFSDHSSKGMRAAAIVETVCRTYPDLILPYVDAIIDKYNSFKHQGVKRGLLKSIRTLSFTEEQTGPIFDLCIKIVMDPKEKAASHVYAMEILVRIAKKYPELKSEVILAIHSRIEYASAAYKARLRLISKDLED